MSSMPENPDPYAGTCTTILKGPGAIRQVDKVQGDTSNKTDTRKHAET